MEYAIFLGCQIPARLNQYESSAKAVLDELGVRWLDIREFNCCGYPLRNIDFKLFLLASARNLALAEKQNLDVMVLCKCCYGSLKKAQFLLKENAPLKEETSRILGREGLRYEGKIKVKHLLSVLYHDVGIEAIKGKMATTFKGLRIATHYGCHVLRPSPAVEFDNPVAPSLFDRLVEATGAESIEWSMKLECCGAPLWGIHDELSIDVTSKKLVDGKKSGADYICVACPYCHLQFDKVQKIILLERGADHPLPSILYTQLLGLSLGIDKKRLGLERNEIPVSGIEEMLVKEAALTGVKELAEKAEQARKASIES